MFDAVLFDLGGVIIDLGGLSEFLRRHDLEESAFWTQWLRLGAGIEFERGDTTPAEFADSFVAEFRLQCTAEQFLTEFAAWPSGTFPGALELVRDVHAVTATLSNTNEVHWETEMVGTELHDLFDHHFPSFRLGLAKPSPAIFERVAGLLDIAPQRLVFVDDNQVNVDAARDVGLTAFRVSGPHEARHALNELGLVAG